MLVPVALLSPELGSQLLPSQTPSFRGSPSPWTGCFEKPWLHVLGRAPCHSGGWSALFLWPTFSSSVLPPNPGNRPDIHSFPGWDSRLPCGGPPWPSGLEALLGRRLWSTGNTPSCNPHPHPT